MTALQLASTIDSSYSPIIAVYGFLLAIKIVRRIFYTL